MTKGTRRPFSPEFRLELAQLVVEQGYSVRDAASAVNVSKSAMEKESDNSSSYKLLYSLLFICPLVCKRKSCNNPF